VVGRGKARLDSLVMRDNKAVEVISRVRVPARAWQGPAATRHVWVHTGKETRVLHESVPIDGKTVVKGMIIRHDQLPANIPMKYRAPLISNEFDKVFLEAQFSATARIYQGEWAYVLRASFCANNRTGNANATNTITARQPTDI